MFFYDKNIATIIRQRNMEVFELQYIMQIVNAPPIQKLVAYILKAKKKKKDRRKLVF